MKVTNPIPEYSIIAPNEAISSWKNHPITRQVLSIMQAEIIYSGERIGRGETLGDNVVQDTARAVGYVEGLEFLESLLVLRDVVETLEDESEAQGKKTA